MTRYYLTKSTELQEQLAVVQYLKLKRWLYIHVPNEAKRDPKQGAILKSMGMSPGFPDLFVFEPRGGFCGLAIEMKRDRTSSVGAEQKKWVNDLREKGYQAFVCYGAADAISRIDDYTKLEEGRPYRADSTTSRKSANKGQWPLV